jgi:hypothetical protein
MSTPAKKDDYYSTLHRHDNVFFALSERAAPGSSSHSHVSFVLPTYHTDGMDIKSLGINFASMMLFFLPMVIYVYRDLTKASIAATLASFAVAYLIPPVGWKRPHPYSDNPNNLPWPRKAE